MNAVRGQRARQNRAVNLEGDPVTSEEVWWTLGNFWRTLLLQLQVWVLVNGSPWAPVAGTLTCDLIMCCRSRKRLHIPKIWRPTMEPFFVKITTMSSFLSLEFWCSEGHLAQFDLILNPSRPIPTYFKTFCRADLTYFHLFRPFLPGWPDLFSLIWTYFVSQ